MISLLVFLWKNVVTNLRQVSQQSLINHLLTVKCQRIGDKGTYLLCTKRGTDLPNLNNAATLWVIELIIYSSISKFLVSITSQSLLNAVLGLVTRVRQLILAMHGVRFTSAIWIGAKIDSFRSAIWFRSAIAIPNPIPNPNHTPNPIPDPIPNRNPDLTVRLTLSQPTLSLTDVQRSI